jgi:type II secretory pathway pseudopilin PulG
VSKKHALVVSAFLALAVLLGAFGAVRTAALSSSARAASTASVTQREHRLDQAERQLRAALARKPPALPPRSANAGAPAPRVEYVRPEPIVITRPSASGEHEQEHESEEADD